MQSHHNGAGVKFGVATVLAAVVGLVGVSGASAAPGDNLRNAAKCLRGWQSLHTINEAGFTGPLQCIVYALRGGKFSVGVTTPPPVPLPAPAPE